MGGLALLLALLPAPQGPAEPPGPPGVEGLLAALRSRTEPRREAARRAWDQLAPAYLAAPLSENRAPLLAVAPEVQEPALEALEASLEAADSSGAVVALVELLGATMNVAGAEELARLLPRLPAAARGSAIEAVAARGGSSVQPVLEALLGSPDAEERKAALGALAAYRSLSRAPSWLSSPAILQLDGPSLAAALERLSSRELPEGFRVPKALYERRDEALLEPLLGVLERAEDPETEEFLVRVVEERHRDRELRRRALLALEKGARTFRWRQGEERLVQLLEVKPPDPMAQEFAWALHRMGNKAGSRYLLAGPQAAVRANPRSWRARFELGRTLVELGEFFDAYSQFQEGVDLVEGTAAWQNVRPRDWLYAARAAAGARRLRDAAAWLEASQMSPQALAPYRDLPEFAPLLDRQPFKRLFGLE